MKDSDFILKQGWMVTKLSLTGIDLELYALIYGFTKDGSSWYETNIANMMDWLQLAERTVQKHLSLLVEAKYILRKQTSLGRKGKILLQANPAILEEIEKGAQYAPIKRVHETTKKGASGAPIEAEKGARNDITPYIRIKEVKDSKRILLSAPARTKQEEDFFEIFFFRGAADPAAEVTDFTNWYEANYEDWNALPSKKKNYYAAAWKLNHGERRQAGGLWLSAWVDVCNWIQENDPENLRQMLDVRFGGRCYRDPIEGNQVIYELSVTRDVARYLCDHKEELLAKYMNQLVKQHNAQVARWNIIDKN